MTQYQYTLCKGLQNLNLCAVKYPIISHLGAYPLSLIVAYSMSPTCYALDLANSPFDFINLSNFVILLVFKKILKYTLFISNTRLKLAKNQANAMQHPEAELLLFKNYSHSSSTLSSKSNRTNSKK